MTILPDDPRYYASAPEASGQFQKSKPGALPPGVTEFDASGANVPAELTPYIQQTDVVQLADLNRQADQALAMLTNYPCDTDEQEQYFADVRVRADEMFKGLEGKRTSYTQPLLAAKRGFDELFAPAKKWRQLSEICMSKIQGRRQRLLEARQAAEKAAFEAARRQEAERQAAEAEAARAQQQAAALAQQAAQAQAGAAQQLADQAAMLAQQAHAATAQAQAIAAQQTAGVVAALATIPDAPVAAGVGEGSAWEADVDLEALRAYLPEAAREFVCIDSSFVKLFCKKHANSTHIPAIPHVTFKRVATVRRK